MDCVICGYEHKKDNRKSKPFIEIEGHFTCREELDYYPDRVYEIYLYACPVCKTVKVDL